jgi:hypothetical protein
MKKTKMYRYPGKNGIITSKVLLEKADRYDMWSLQADEGKILSDGEQFVHATTIFAEELDKWVEIEDPEYIGEVK